jgi:hypothetical protein
MTYTVEDFKRDTQRLRIAHLHELDPELFQTLLAEIPTEALLSRLAPEERLRGLDPAERLRGLDPEQRLSGLDPAVVEDWLKRRGH